MGRIKTGGIFVKKNLAAILNKKKEGGVRIRVNFGLNKFLKKEIIEKFFND